MLERVSSKEEARQAVASARREGKAIGLVPTMGALHDGHLSLVRAACERADYVVVSIFVNPTQFGDDADFDSYPRDVGADLELLAAEGVDLAFTPSAEVMYGGDPQVTVEPGPLAARWEGEARPGHFAGVATVVTKLFNLVRPDLAFFGEKDFQQLRVIERLAVDLDTGVTVIACPVVREPDGLALSSRNSHLSAEERTRALGLSSALEAAARTLADGERDASALVAAMQGTATEAGVDVDYAAVVEPRTLEPVDTVDMPVRALIAGRAGATRLIDNRRLVPAEE